MVTLALSQIHNKPEGTLKRVNLLLIENTLRRVNLHVQLL
jgi:hypothetical protein